MNEIERLQYLLNETYSGNCFHGDSIAQIFNSVDPVTAAWSPDGKTHSIWQIVLHMTAWQNAIRERLTSPTLVTLADEQNYPAVPQPTLETWSATLDQFRDALQALGKAIAKFPEDKLEASVPGRGYTFDVLLHGAIHHNLYHIGQVSLLKAMYQRLGTGKT